MRLVPLVKFEHLKKKYHHISQKKYKFLPLYPTPELAEFLGMLITEGTINKSGIINFVNTDNYLLRRYYFLMHHLFRRKIVTIKRVQGFKHKKKCLVLRIMSTSLLKVFKETNLPVGRRSMKDYDLPLFIRNPELFNVSKEDARKIQSTFLKTIFSCDGSRPFKILSEPNNYKLWIRYEITKNDYIDSGKRFLSQIKRLLKNFDIDTTRIYQYKNRLFFNITRKNALLNFYKHIGYSIDYKQKDLEDLIDFIINFKTIVQKRRDKILELLNKPRTTKEIRDIIGLHFSKTYGHLIYLEKKGLIKREKGRSIRSKNNKFFNGMTQSIWVRR